MAPTFVSGIPIYVQIADDIRAQILRGALRGGDQLTSTTEYSATYRINPATVGKAFAILVDEGLVEKRRGIGMFVAEGARGALAAVEPQELREHVVDVDDLDGALQRLKGESFKRLWIFVVV